ncbi:phage tail tape measure protein [Staphylococcus aureus]
MPNPIGNMVIKVDLDGSGFNRGVTGLNRQMKMVSRELSANLSQFSRYDNSLEKSKIKVEGLSKKQKVQAQITKELKDSYDKLSKETGENSAKTQAAAAKYNEAYAKLNQYERELNQATQELKDMQREQKALNTAMGKLGTNFNNFGPKLQEIGNSMKNVGRNMTMYVTAPVVAGFAVAAKKGIEFDDSMRKVKATSGATGEEFEALKKKAREMGATTKFSASDSAEALNYMALAGWDSKQMMEGLSGVMDLAAASGEELGAVSDIVTDGLTAFGLKAKDSGHFADVLAQTSSKANTDVRGLGEAFKYVAPVAGALGYTIEDTSIAIGLMSNAGIKGEKAGTALRTMFTNLSSPTRAMGNEMERLGISITDSNGKMIPMRKLLDQLREKFKHLSKDQQASSAATIFGKEAMSGALAIINASDEDYQKLTKSIDSSTGASKRMADTMESGLGGKLRTLRSQLEELALTIYDRIEPALKIIVSAFSKVVTWVTKLPTSIQLAVVGFGLFVAVLGPLVFMFGLFISVMGNAMTVLGPLLINVNKASGLFAFLRTKIASLVKLFPILGVSISSLTLPITLIVGALVGIGIAFYQAYKRSETFRNIVNQAISGVANAFKAAKLALQGFFDLFKGDSKGAVTLEKIFPPETVAGIQNVVNTIRTTFFKVVDAIVGFAKEIGAQLASFWKENGSEITQALQNIAGFIKATFEFIFNFIIKPIMFAIWQVMQFIWPAVKALIVSTWENIKGVIQGAINIILGIIKVFSSLFTGNWRGVWDGIVMILKGTVQLIWNLIQLWFVGKILGVVRYFGGLLKGLITIIWVAIIGVFKKSLSAFNWTKDQIGKGTKWLGDKVGDVMDFIDNPGKLLNYVLQAFGVDFSSLTKGMGIAGDITKAAWSKIKKSAIKWLEDAFAESGDGGVLDMSKLRYLYGHTAAYTRETGRPFHEGLDFDYIYEPVPSTINGRAQVMPFHNGGYGKWVKIVKGALEVIYAHLSKYKVKTGQQVRVGQTVGISGDTGFSTGPHLHYEMRWNGRHRDPLPWLRKNNGGGKSAPGGNGAANARRAIKAAQNILGGRYKASWITNEMMRVASRESNYTANAVNNWDSNARAGIPSRGMFQMIDPSFRAYAKSGYNNPLNPTHQAISAMRYIVGKWVPRTGSWRAAFKRAGDYAYATGGKVYNGLYHLGEEGYPEWIIPTDPSRANEAHKLLALAANDIDNRSKNKRPNNLPNPSISNSDTNYIHTLENKLDAVINCLVSLVESNQVIADKDYEPVINKYVFEDEVNNSIDKRERHESTRVRFRRGGTII